MNTRRIALVVPGICTLVLLISTTGRAAEPCPYTCGDLDGDQIVGASDTAAFVGCLGGDPGLSVACGCADLDGSGAIDLRDFAQFTRQFAKTSDEFPPACTGAAGTSGGLTAYRPQHRTGYAPLVRTSVPDATEDDPALGPGIRINAPGDNDPAGEDDLIEVRVDVEPPSADFSLRRSSTNLRVWTTRDKQAGTEIGFTANRSAALPLGAAASLTVWVEWAASTHGTATLQLEPIGSPAVKDALTFHTYRSLIIALGGEGQVPSYPVDSNHGTFLVAEVLYHMGYDVLLFDEDVVNSDGSGSAYDEIATAIEHRGIDEVAIFGYSHGGGSTHDLADRLDVNRGALGLFEIVYTAYVDSVSNNSDIDTGQELRRPPSTAFHVNHYQHGSFFQDLGLDGGPVSDSQPPPTGLDVETTPWGAGSTHFEVDDYLEVRSLMESLLLPRVTR